MIWLSSSLNKIYQQQDLFTYQPKLVALGPRNVSLPHTCLKIVGLLSQAHGAHVPLLHGQFQPIRIWLSSKFCHIIYIKENGDEGGEGYHVITHISSPFR